MFEHIRHQLMEWFDERSTLEDRTTGLLVRKAAQQLQIATNERARRYCVVRSIPGTLFKAKSIETQCNYIINLVERTCSCFIWQSSGIPCGHAISIILQQKADPQHYVESVFTIEAYKKTYEQPLFPLHLANVNGDARHDAQNSDSELESEESDDDTLDVLPPSTRHPPGRPKNRRIRGQHEQGPKRVYTCTRCHLVGHSKATCMEPIDHTVTPAGSQSAARRSGRSQGIRWEHIHQA